ncbi:MAG: 30S ribosomal protein S10 [Mycoplasmataceae bacterium]|nr:MAG: 30S ribosomal protein S10 [Mycoplasmataceae bacterium]
MKNNSNNELKIVVQGYDISTIEESVLKIIKQTNSLKLKFSGPIPLPVKREIVTVLTSPHKHKTAREQFERRTHNRLITVFDVNQSHLEFYSRLQIPRSVYVKIKYQANQK